MARPKLEHFWRPQRKEILRAAVAVMLWLPTYFYLNQVGEKLPYALLITLSIQTVGVLWYRRCPLFTLGLITVSIIAYTLIVPHPQDAISLSAYEIREQINILLHLGLIAWGPAVAIFSTSSKHRHTVAITASTIFIAMLLPLFYLKSSYCEQHQHQIALYLLMLIGCHIIGAYRRSATRSRYALENEIQKLTLKNEQIQQLAIVSERARIAREMHDIIAHSLSVMITLADGAKANLGKNPGQTEKALEMLTATGRTALAEARKLVNVLRNPEGESIDQPKMRLTETQSDPKTPLSPQPTYEDIKTLIQRFLDAGMPIESHLDVTVPPQDPGLNLTLFRIVQESLTNILRYAPRTPRIIITTERALGSITVTVENAPDPNAKITPGSGKGIVGMKERVSVYNGQIEAGPSKLGWRVKAILRWTETSDGMIAWKAPQ